MQMLYFQNNNWHFLCIAIFYIRKIKISEIQDLLHSKGDF